MAIVETNRVTTTELGRISETVETYDEGISEIVKAAQTIGRTVVHQPGSSSTTKGAQTIGRAVTHAQGTSTTTKGAQIVSKSEVRPQIVARKGAAVHVGVEFQFTLSWQGKGNKG